VHKFKHDGNTYTLISQNKTKTSKQKIHLVHQMNNITTIHKFTLKLCFFINVSVVIISNPSFRIKLITSFDNTRLEKISENIFHGRRKDPVKPVAYSWHMNMIVISPSSLLRDKLRSTLIATASAWIVKRGEIFVVTSSHFQQRHARNKTLINDAWSKVEKNTSSFAVTLMHSCTRLHASFLQQNAPCRSAFANYFTHNYTVWNTRRISNP